MLVWITQMKIRRYSELITLPTFEERFRYLKLDGRVGKDTFGFDRFLNQQFYKSEEWKKVRNEIIVRDSYFGDYCFDLGCEGHEIYGNVIVHHMNPLSVKDIRLNTKYLLNPEYLISTYLPTHNAIHYGDESSLISAPVERFKNDTCPWKN